MKHRKKFNISGAGLAIFGVTIGKIIFSEENIGKIPPLIQAGASFAIPILIYVITYIFSPKDLIYVKCIAGSYMVFAIPQSIIILIQLYYYNFYITYKNYFDLILFIAFIFFVLVMLIGAAKKQQLKIETKYFL